MSLPFEYGHGRADPPPGFYEFAHDLGENYGNGTGLTMCGWRVQLGGGPPSRKPPCPVCMANSPQVVNI